MWTHYETTHSVNPWDHSDACESVLHCANKVPQKGGRKGEISECTASLNLISKLFHELSPNFRGYTKITQTGVLFLFLFFFQGSL